MLNIHKIELFISGLLLMLYISAFNLIIFLSNLIAYCAFAFLSTFLFFLLFYIIKGPLEKGNKGSRNNSTILHIAFIFLLVFYFSTFLVSGQLALTPLVNTAFTLTIVGSFLVLMLPMLFLSFITVYLVKIGKWNWKHWLLFAIITFIILAETYLFLFNSGVYQSDDELFLEFQGAHMLFNGQNPYNSSVSYLIYQNFSKISGTLTTKNTIMGTMDYPALFFLSFVPFYLTAAPTLKNFMDVQTPLQMAFFMTILLYTFAYSLDKKTVSQPRLLLFVFFTFAIVMLSSATNFLMLLLLLLAYTKIDSKYAWLFLGLCLSVQEQLWLPVFFLLLYSANNYGIRKGTYNTAGAAAVFLIINSYFIAINPSAFFGAIFSTVNQFILPIPPSAFTFALMKFYPILFSSYSQLFIIISLMLGVALLYLNKKELIPVFSLIPLLILPHTIPSYYAFFIFVIFFALEIQQKKQVQGKIQTYLQKEKRVFLSLMSLMVLAIIAVLYTSHSAYQTNFGVQIQNRNLLVYASNHTSVQNITIGYKHLSNNTVYVIDFASANFGILDYGLINQSIIGSPAKCSDYQCMINVNRVVLPANSTGYNLNLRLNWPNATKKIVCSSAVIYNGEYFYAGDGICNFTG